MPSIFPMSVSSTLLLSAFMSVSPLQELPKAPPAEYASRFFLASRGPRMPFREMSTKKRRRQPLLDWGTVNQSFHF